MTGEQFERVELLFHRALGLPPDQRSGFLDRECGDDPEVREEVRRLTEHRERVDSFGAMGREVSRMVGDALAHEAGQEIGGYRLVRRVGEGGMGVVWQAEQREPVQRVVALKLIKWGMDTRAVVARFDAERQALARMSHPGIARVFDAGTSDRGRPYFAMELVDGPPITEYCDKNRLEVRERLELFVAVCDAIQHAHQRGVIHRDVKPSNVLVQVLDGTVTPKVIDFGVAKAIDQRATEHTASTLLGQLIGTPEYASPEQAVGVGVDVDTRTDVYSLGVLLYELLVGARPFEADGPPTDLDGLRRRIREEEPSRPSVRVARLGRSGTARAVERGTDPAALARRLRGDLDWITMKALEKDPARRYASASELAADVRRHLRHEPVAAGPPGPAYRLGKLVRRHRVGVTATVLVAVALVGGSAIALVGLVRARAEARQRAVEAETARQVSEFLLDLFGSSDPGRARGEPVTTRDVLDRGAERIATELGDRPRVQARLMHSIGSVYTSLGHYDRAIPLLQDAAERRGELLGTDDLETMESMAALADAHWYAGRYDVAGEIYVEVLERRTRVLGADAPATVETLKALADTHWASGRYAEAEPLYEQALGIRDRTLGPDHLDTIECLNGLAILRAQRGEHDAAQPLFTRVLDARRRTLGHDHPATLKAITNLANVERLRGRHEVAERLFLESLDAQRRVVGPDHRDTLTTMESLASVLQHQGRLEEAETVFLDALERFHGALGPEHRETIRVTGNLGNLYSAMGRHDEALRYHERALAHAVESLGVDHPRTAQLRTNVGVDQKNLGRLDDAAVTLAQALADQTRVNGAEHVDRLEALWQLARVSALRGDGERLVELLRDAASSGWTHEDLLGEPDLARYADDPGLHAIARELRGQV